MLLHQRIEIFALGRWEVDRDSFSNGYPVYSGVMFCPVCCTIWAELAISTRENFFEPRCVPCSRCTSALHRDLRPVPGSILDNQTCNGIDVSLLNALPLVLLEREFSLALEHIPDE